VVEEIPGQRQSWFKASYHQVGPKVRPLEEENVRLKRIIAKQVLEMEVKDEFLKKAMLKKMFQF